MALQGPGSGSSLHFISTEGSTLIAHEDINNGIVMKNKNDRILILEFIKILNIKPFKNVSEYYFDGYTSL